MEMREARIAKIAKLIRLTHNDNDNAKALLEAIVFSPDRQMLSTTAEMALIDLCRKRHELDALENKMSATAELHYRFQPALELIPLARAAERKEIEKLWDPIAKGQDSPVKRYVYPRTRYAVRLLSEIPAAKERMMQEVAKDGPAGLWAELILARMQAPEAFVVLTQRLKTESNADQMQVHLHSLAILGTPQAYEQLKLLAKNEKNRFAWDAKQTLAQWPMPGVARDVGD